MRRAFTLLADLPGLLALLVLTWLLTSSVAGRIGYPFDLEWMEGGMLLHARRVMAGLPLYAPPSVDWIPFIYPPLYPWVLGASAELFGLDYALGRAISLLGVGLSLGAMALALRREGASPWLAAGTGALFLSTYEDSGTFFDIVRTDGLLLALLSWSLVFVRRGRIVAGALLLVLAFMAKHNAAIFGLPCLLWLWWARGRAEALRYAAWSLGPALLFLGGMQLASQGTFLVYLVQVPAYHPFVLDRFFPGAPLELWGALQWGLVLLLLSALSPWLARRFAAPGPDRLDQRQGRVFWAAQVALAVVLAMVMRGHHGGYMNVLMPAHFLLALGVGLGAQALRQAVPGPFMVGVTSLVLGLQAWQGRWELDKVVPDEADRRAGEEVLAELRAIEGPVLMPHSPWMLVQAGKEPGFHLIALWDIDHGGPFQEGVQAFEAAVAERHWTTAIMPDQKFGFGLSKAYRLERTLRYQGRAFLPVTGWQVRPRYLYQPSALLRTPEQAP